MENLEREVNRLMQLPWEKEYIFTKISEEDGGGWYGYVKPFGSGCCADGDSIKEVTENLRISLEVTLEHFLEMGWEIPVI